MKNENIAKSRSRLLGSHCYAFDEGGRLVAVEVSPRRKSTAALLTESAKSSLKARRTTTTKPGTLTTSRLSSSGCSRRVRVAQSRHASNHSRPLCSATRSARFARQPQPHRTGRSPRVAEAKTLDAACRYAQAVWLPESKHEIGFRSGLSRTLRADAR